MSTVFPSLRDWRCDVSTKPTVSSRKGNRVEVTAGRAGRAERLLKRGDDPEHVSAVTGLPPFVVNEIAERIVSEEIEAEDSIEPERHKRRREWITILNECHLRDSHLVLVQVAENYYKVQRYWEAWSIARMAVLLLLRARWFVMAGKMETTQDDPGKLLTKMRSFGGIDRRAFDSARRCLQHHRKIHLRAEGTLEAARILHALFGDFGEDADKAPRHLEEARRVYCGKSAPEEPVSV